MARPRPKRPAKQKSKQPEELCCPICRRPALVKARIDGVMTTNKGCVFFARMQNKKFDDDPKKSAKLRSKAFREFHADICPRCRCPIDECRDRKIAKAKRDFTKAFKEGRRDTDYVHDHEITAAVKEIACSPPDEWRYTIKIPDWYTP